MEKQEIKSDRYTHLRATLGVELFEKVRAAKLLVVGAGGIGCELLKNLVLTGFRDIEVIDLDTIDVSNLNRQFLFRQQHVGKSKAIIAREVVLKFNPDAKIVAHHGNVKDHQFGLTYIEKFDIVLNALDNLDARRHVNRLCLAKNKPLIESGTTGFLGQVTVIKKGETECYDCNAKVPQKQYPICTIRATPDKPVHCIVWAKEAFKLLFGDMSASMLYEDPSTSAADKSLYMEDVLNRPVQKEGGKSVTEADMLEYARKFIVGQYINEIQKKIDMDLYKVAANLPKPLSVDLVNETVKSYADAPSKAAGAGWDRKEWGVKDSIREIVSCIMEVYSSKSLLKLVGHMDFDKDDSIAMRFVTAASNLRAEVFYIKPLQSFYQAKGIAGNIVPAIATTNAIIGGLQVSEALKILENKGPISEECKYIYCLRLKTRKGLFLQPSALKHPNPDCYVCNTSTVEVRCNVETMTLQQLVDDVLKKHLGINEPNVMIGSSGIYEEGDGCDESLRANLPKVLKDLPAGGIVDGTHLSVEDFSQDVTLHVAIFHKILDELEVPTGFLVAGSAPSSSAGGGSSSSSSSGGGSSNSGGGGGGSSSSGGGAAAAVAAADDGDDDFVIIVDMASRKRRREETSKLDQQQQQRGGGGREDRGEEDDDDEETGEGGNARKRVKSSKGKGKGKGKLATAVPLDDDDDIICLDG